MKEKAGKFVHGINMAVDRIQDVLANLNIKP